MYVAPIYQSQPAPKPPGLFLELTQAAHSEPAVDCAVNEPFLTICVNDTEDRCIDPLTDPIQSAVVSHIDLTLDLLASNASTINCKATVNQPEQEASSTELEISQCQIEENNTDAAEPQGDVLYRPTKDHSSHTAEAAIITSEESAYKPAQVLLEGADVSPQASIRHDQKLRLPLPAPTEYKDTLDDIEDKKAQIIKKPISRNVKIRKFDMLSAGLPLKTQNHVRHWHKCSLRYS